MANSKRVLMICSDYMEDLEAMVPFQALKAYGASVDAVCPGKNDGDKCRTVIQQNTYRELCGHNFTLNKTFALIDASEYNGLVITGWRAPEYLAMNQSVINLVKHFIDSGKPISCICHGPLILAAADAIRGRLCTGYPTMQPVVVAAGGQWVEAVTMAQCTINGNLITAATYEAHTEYIKGFIKALRGNISGSSKRILFLCGDYMEDYEVTVPFQALGALGCHVDAVCPKKGAGDKCVTVVHEQEGDQTYNLKFGHDFTLTANFEAVNPSIYDALVIPGGQAPEYLALDEAVLNLVKEFIKAAKPVASIGHGPLILSAAGVLRGRRCTADPTVKLNVILAGGTWVEPETNRCVTDGNLVTGAFWLGLPEFISQLMALLLIPAPFSGTP